MHNETLKTLYAVTNEGNKHGVNVIAVAKSQNILLKQNTEIVVFDNEYFLSSYLPTLVSTGAFLAQSYSSTLFYQKF